MESDFWIAEIEKGVYLAGWHGDPGRTGVKRNAVRYSKEEYAVKAIAEARANYRPFIDAKPVFMKSLVGA